MSGADLQRELTDLAETEEPPTSLDVDRAVRAGKRRNRIRTAATAAACAAVVAVSSVAIPSLLGDRGPERPAAPEESTPRPMPPTRVDTTHNPMVTHARFGWLPDSMTTVRYAAGPGYGDNLTALGETGGDASGHMTTDGGRLFLSTHDEDPGVTRAQEQTYPGRTPHRIPTTIAGREGYWLTFTASDRLTAGQGSLRWKLPNGKWALLSGSQMSFDDPVQVMERIASDVRAGDRLEPLPVRVSSLPEGFSLVTAHMERALDADPARLSVSLIYMFKGSSVTIALGEGAEAKQRADACKTENDMKVCVSAFADAQRVLETVGGPEGLLNRVAALGYDRSEWTTEVIG